VVGVPTVLSERPVMSVYNTPNPSTGEIVEGLSFFPIALVVSATIFPGLVICIPGLIFGAAFILIPLLAIALVLLVVGAVIAAPFLAVRGIRALVRRHTEKVASADPVEALAPVAFAPTRFAAVHRLTAEAPLHPQPHRSTVQG
jgi:hypothetical protein